MKVIRTISDLIETMGGATKLARWAGYEDSRGVCNWLSRGIPPSYHLRLTLEAKRKGLVIDPDVFGLESEDAAVLRSVLKRRDHHAA